MQHANPKYGVLGSGSWGTALTKILTDNGQHVNWFTRHAHTAAHIAARGHNPQYLPQVSFNVSLLTLYTDAAALVAQSDVIVVAVPSAFITQLFLAFDPAAFNGKQIISAVKGILPDQNLLLNDYLRQQFNFPLQDYFAVLGPCHAEEIAAEKLSYLTISGLNQPLAEAIAAHFATSYVNTIVNTDIFGVQYAAVLKNIYAVAAGIANGLGYGDNFLSVLIANSADEMAAFLRKAGIVNAEVGNLDHAHHQLAKNNYAASVYLGDLLVTCYSLHSRNRAFGNLLGRGYSVQAAQQEMKMVAEGYFASKTMQHINRSVQAEMPIATGVHAILWNGEPARSVFRSLEKNLI